MNDRIGVNGGNPEAWTCGKQMPVDLQGYTLEDNGVREIEVVAGLQRNVKAALILRSH